MSKTYTRLKFCLFLRPIIRISNKFTPSSIKKLGRTTFLALLETVRLSDGVRRKMVGKIGPLLSFKARARSEKPKVTKVCLTVICSKLDQLTKVGFFAN